ncbi:MAG: hypothetical protein M9954_10210 [Cyclobacteriaceae bacterium]|nr:hypothetical protein [Cyclobacteriaceae bacterium]MCB0499064.1 hypothetical protein [Cyclobacteriaceae bacterium]MCB9238340.1 hypothetical protein [Flammeovirgaceae bacterium]MCO5272022.1 hypothetical protein [Cyclobacteriaceae bacterium]MCW5902942.1 hypothetical protein [Cyclobacteriaceae bacterium]
MEAPGTLPEVLRLLAEKGYSSEFSLQPGRDRLVCRKTTRHLSPDEFDIDEVHPLGDVPGAGRGTVVFALSSMKYNIKGVVVNTLGARMEATGSKVIEKLKVHMLAQGMDGPANGHGHQAPENKRIRYDQDTTC